MPLPSVTTEGPLAKLLSPKEAAEFLGISEGHLAKLRCEGGGPVYSKLGVNVRYLPQDLLAYVVARRRMSTAGHGQAA
jgi:hypothetical protein